MRYHYGPFTRHAKYHFGFYRLPYHFGYSEYVKTGWLPERHKFSTCTSYRWWRLFFFVEKKCEAILDPEKDYSKDVATMSKMETVEETEGE